MAQQVEFFDKQFANEIWRYVTGVDDRQKAAEARHLELVKVHREGWAKLATAIEKGLGRIAEAIAERR
jgi:hypothetical protein